MRLHLNSPDAANHLQAWCRARAEHHPIHAVQPVLDDLTNDPHYLQGGAAASLELTVSVPDIYMPQDEYRQLLPAAPIRPALHDMPDAILHVVPSQNDLERMAHPHQPGKAHPAIAGIDMMDEGSPRSVREGSHLIRASLEGWLNP